MIGLGLVGGETGKRTGNCVTFNLSWTQKVNVIHATTGSDK